MSNLRGQLADLSCEITRSNARGSKTGAGREAGSWEEVVVEEKEKSIFEPNLLDDEAFYLLRNDSTSVHYIVEKFYGQTLKLNQWLL